MRYVWSEIFQNYKITFASTIWALQKMVVWFQMRWIVIENAVGKHYRDIRNVAIE